MKRILILEPYYSGSHKHFLEGLQRYVTANYLVFTLPGRKWKMRMQLSAPWFVEQIKALPEAEQYFDCVLCSTFVDVAVLRALLIGEAGWNSKAKVLIYFHENQFVYPQQFNKSSQYQFMNINFHSALAADAIAFNSEFNRKSFFAGCRKIMKATRDMKLPGIVKKLVDKSQVLYPGIEFAEIDKMEWKMQSDIPVIVWNHRWEHDKNPESYFSALELLKQRGFDFRLIVLGQEFERSPACFALAKKKFKNKIIHFGFVPTYKKYIELLSQGDIVISTAHHEFYGISIIEAVRAGCVPILPDRLSYPELFDKKFLYSDDSLAEKLEKIIGKHCRLSREKAKALTDPFNWVNVQKQYSEWL